MPTIDVPFPITGATGRGGNGKPTAIATIGSVTYTCSGNDIRHATLTFGAESWPKQASLSKRRSPRPTADVLVVGPGGSYNHDLGLLAVFVALFGGLDRKAHRFRLALVRTVFFIIKLDHPSVAVGL